MSQQTVHFEWLIVHLFYLFFIVRTVNLKNGV